MIMPEHMQSYNQSIFSNLTQGEMIQIVTITLILIYLIFSLLKKMINFRSIKEQIIKYKKEILFTVAMAMICFSIALWAIGVNIIKYHNILGSY